MEKKTKIMRFSANSWLNYKHALHKQYTIIGPERHCSSPRIASIISTSALPV